MLMMVTRQWLFLGAIIGMAALPSVGFAFSMSSLQNLPGVGVNVKRLPPDALKLGVSEATLRAVLADGLTEAGVPLYDGDKLNTAPGAPILELSVLVKKVRGEDSFIFSARLSLQEMVSLERPTENLASIYAPTWEKHVLGVTDHAAYVRSAARQLLARFVKEYREEN